MTLVYDRLFRSQILYEVITLEEALDSIIAAYFCPDETKHGAFKSFLFQDGGISFGKKIRIVGSILKHCYPDFQQAFGFLLERLRRLNQLRNKFAHSQVVLPAAALPPNRAEGVMLRCHTSGGPVEEFISRAEVDAQVHRCRDLGLVAVLLAELVRGRAIGGLEAAEERALMNAAKALKHKVTKENKVT